MDIFQEYWFLNCSVQTAYYVERQNDCLSAHRHLPFRQIYKKTKYGCGETQYGQCPVAEMLPLHSDRFHHGGSCYGDHADVVFLAEGLSSAGHFCRGPGRTQQLVNSLEAEELPLGVHGFYNAI